MYKPDNSKVKNFYNQFTNPSGKAPMPTNLGGFLGTAPKSIKDFFGGMKSPAVSNPNAKFDINNIPDGPMSKYVPTEGPVRPSNVSPAPVGNVGSTQLFGGGQQQAPAATAPAQAPSGIPSQYLRPDGTQMTPEEYVESVKSQMKIRTGEGDIGTYAASQFLGGEKTAEQLANEARQFANAKGDLASGTTDPYGIASKSGIAYSPEELRAIENAAAGIYEPALTTAIGKLEAKQKADADEKKWQQELEKLNIQNEFDLSKMDKQFAYDKILLGLKQAADAKAAAGGITPYSDERSFRTVQSIDNLVGQVNNWTTGFGTLLNKIPTTDAKYFKGQLDTLKSSIAFGELTAMREASKTGGALGNVSNIELNLLENALASLDQAQSPEQVKTELEKAKASINRWRTAQGANVLGAQEVSAQPQTMILNGQTLTLQPDGTYE